MASEAGPQLIEPVVLAGGLSRRFGRDKLAEPIDDAMLIDGPIRALRGVFGPRVAIVGACDPRVAARADLVFDDPYPGVGPIGGVLAALEASRGAVFVLAGDLLSMTSEAIGAVLVAAESAPEALAAVAMTDRPEPCIGLYRPQAAEPLRRAVARGQYSLRDALPTDRVALAPIDAAAARNINRESDLLQRE